MPLAVHGEPVHGRVRRAHTCRTRPNQLHGCTDFNQRSKLRSPEGSPGPRRGKCDNKRGDGCASMQLWTSHCSNGNALCAGMPATRQARLKRGKGGSGSCSFFFFFSGGKERKRKENKTPREKAGKRELKQEQRERKKERDLGIQQQTKCSESPGRPRC